MWVKQREVTLLKPEKFSGSGSDSLWELHFSQLFCGYARCMMFQHLSECSRVNLGGFDLSQT